MHVTSSHPIEMSKVMTWRRGMIRMVHDVTLHRRIAVHSLHAAGIAASHRHRRTDVGTMEMRWRWVITRIMKVRMGRWWWKIHVRMRRHVLMTGRRWKTAISHVSRMRQSTSVVGEGSVHVIVVDAHRWWTIWAAGRGHVGRSEHGITRS